MMSKVTNVSKEPGPVHGLAFGAAIPDQGSRALEGRRRFATIANQEVQARVQETGAGTRPPSTFAGTTAGSDGHV
jgi:hypothetical protein